MVADDIALILIYIFEENFFPVYGSGASDLKSEKHTVISDYKGISILPIIEKMLEMVVYRRLSFANVKWKQNI